jgi:hypothetical protein
MCRRLLIELFLLLCCKSVRCRPVISAPLCVHDEQDPTQRSRRTASASFCVTLLAIFDPSTPNFVICLLRRELGHAVSTSSRCSGAALFTEQLLPPGRAAVSVDVSPRHKGTQVHSQEPHRFFVHFCDSQGSGACVLTRVLPELCFYSGRCFLDPQELKMVEVGEKSTCLQFLQFSALGPTICPHQIN